MPTRSSSSRPVSTPIFGMPKNSGRLRQRQREEVADGERQPGVEREPLRDVADVLGVGLRVVVAAVELDRRRGTGTRRPARAGASSCPDPFRPISAVIWPRAMSAVTPLQDRAAAQLDAQVADRDERRRSHRQRATGGERPELRHFIASARASRFARIFALVPVRRSVRPACTVSSGSSSTSTGSGTPFAAEFLHESPSPAFDVPYCGSTAITRIGFFSSVQSAIELLQLRRRSAPARVLLHARRRSSGRTPWRSTPSSRGR